MNDEWMVCEEPLSVGDLIVTCPFSGRKMVQKANTSCLIPEKDPLGSVLSTKGPMGHVLVRFDGGVNGNPGVEVRF